jgi:hypothetical protein
VPDWVKTNLFVLAIAPPSGSEPAKIQVPESTFKYVTSWWVAAI